MASSSGPMTNPKSTNGQKMSSSASQLSPIQTVSSLGAEIFNQKRGSSGGVGADAYSKPMAAPRNSSSKKSHKSTRRFQMDEDSRAEAATIRSTTTRKGQTSITHLMNLAPSIPALYGGHRTNLGRRDRKEVGSWYGRHCHLDKARYVNANYRFIVDPRVDYHVYSRDADEYLDWASVLQVIVSPQSQASACPICLDHPTAPRMTKCGHIFCLQCLIQFLHSEGENAPRTYEKQARYKKCPLCWELIYMSDARSVRWFTGSEGTPPREGDDMCLRLVRREATSTLALPRDGAEALCRNEDIPWYFAAEVMDYARIMKGSQSYMESHLDSEIAAITNQEKEDELMFGDDTLEWSQKAIRLLVEQKEKIKDIGGPSESANGLDSAQSPEVNTSDGPARTSLHPVPMRFDARWDQSPPSAYYFYQGLLHCYLAPLDIRILKEAFGTFASFPATILPRIERICRHVMDDELRKSKKWLSHLPRGCEVCFLECNWTDTVPEDVLDKFRSELERRRQCKMEQEIRDEKARMRAEKEEDQRYAHVRRRLPEQHESSWFRRDDFQPLTHDESDRDEAETSTSPPWSNRSASSPFTSLAHMSTSPSATRTIWGTPMVPGSSSRQDVSAQIDKLDDGWLHDWERDVLEHQEEELVSEAQALSLAVETGKKQKKQKKQKKKITIMSTSVRRAA